VGGRAGEGRGEITVAASGGAMADEAVGTVYPLSHGYRFRRARHRVVGIRPRGAGNEQGLSGERKPSDGYEDADSDEEGRPLLLSRGAGYGAALQWAQGPAPSDEEQGAAHDAQDEAKHGGGVEQLEGKPPAL